MNNPLTKLGPWRRFSARFDDVLLRAPQVGAGRPGAPLCADALALERALAALCEPGPRYASARHTLAATPELRTQQQLWLQQRLLALDGTLHMQSLGKPWRQRLHRLAIKLCETWGRADAAQGGPWDCGLLNSGPAARASAQQFTPRRPTLMVAWELPPETLAPMLRSMQQRQGGFAQPVRLWVLTSLHT